MAQGSRPRVHADVEGPDGTYWSADFTPAAGDVLAPGTYTDATRFPFNGTGPGLSVSGSGRGCNTLTGSFTVKQAVFNRLDGSWSASSSTSSSTARAGPRRCAAPSPTGPPPTSRCPRG